LHRRVRHRNCDRGCQPSYLIETTAKMETGRHTRRPFFSRSSRESWGVVGQRREVIGYARHSAAGTGPRGRARMRYKPKSVAALHIALGGLPDKMRVEVDRGIRVSAKTVGELRKVTAWPDNLVIIPPQERRPESTAKVSKASVATRVSPKP